MTRHMHETLATVSTYRDIIHTTFAGGALGVHTRHNSFVAYERAGYKKKGVTGDCHFIMTK